MADELRDLRAKITVETDVAVDAISRVTGRDRSEIVRDVLHKWALEQVQIATVLNNKLKGEGIAAALEGARGNIASLKAGQ